MSLFDDEPFDAIMTAAVDAVLVIDSRGIIQQASDSVESFFGYLPAECLGKNVSLLMPSAVGQAHDGYLANYLAGGLPKIIGTGRKVQGQTQNGHVFPMHLSVGQFDHKDTHYFVGICHDLSDYDRTMDQLQDAEKRYKDIVESQNHFICRLDDSLHVTFANRFLLSALGLRYDEIQGRAITSIMAGNDLSFTHAIETLFSEEGVDEVCIKVALKTRDSATIAEWSFRKVDNDTGASREIQGLGIDISAREAAISRAKYLDNHDQLTGVLKPRPMIAQMETSGASGQSYAFYYLDVKRFAQINRRFGNDAGDQVIVYIAKRLQSVLPKGAWIARPGGDEFLIACPAADQADAASIGRSFAAIFNRPFIIHQEQYLLDCTIGVAMFPTDTDELARMPELAESAQREATHRGEAIVFFDQASQQNLLRKITIEQALKTALNVGQLRVYLQPKINLTSSRVSCFEALVRWDHPQLGSVSPAEFIPIAESTGLGVRLDQYVLRKVAEMITEVRRAAGECQPIGVNITAGHFSDSNIFDCLAGLIEEFSLPARAIELEITEGMILGACNHTSENFKRLRDLGIRISIDDFGTGYSSLSYLKRLDVDELKIDKSFIDDICKPQGEAVIKAIIDIGKAYGLEITAEGVETEEQARRLCDLGCTTGQGYFFSPPIPAHEALQWQPDREWPIANPASGHKKTPLVRGKISAVLEEDAREN